MAEDSRERGLVLRGGVVIDGGAVMPAAGTGARVLGEAVLVRGGRVVCVGKERAVRAASRGDEEVVELEGRTVTPGLVDSHCHLDGVGRAKQCLELSGARSTGECLALVREAAGKRRGGQWVIGFGLNPNVWVDGGAGARPTAAELDAAAGGKPVVLGQFDGHCCWANSAALAASSITATTADPGGGRIGRNEKGRMTGWLYERAMALVRPPAPTAAEQEEALRLGIESYGELGYTAVHVMGAGSHEPVTDLLEMARALAAEERLSLRVRGYPLAEHLAAAAADVRRHGRDSWCRVAGIKTFYDGSLNSETAWMFEEYRGGRGNRGMAVITQEDLRAQVRAANGAGLPLACHAIGDRAIHEVLSVFEQERWEGLANRIEHVQHLRPEDLRRFAGSNTAASMQTCHLIADWGTAERLLGERARWSYAARSLVAAGATVILGTDAPVVSADPVDSLVAAVKRTDRAGRPVGGWHQEEGVTAAQWLWMHTVGPWRVTGESGERGLLEAGMDADMTVWSGNPMKAAEDEGGLAALRAEATVVGGRVRRRGE